MRIGGRPIGDERGRDDDVDLSGLGGEECHLRGDEARAHLLGIASAAFALFVEGHLEKLSAHAFDLVSDGCARVESAHDGSQPACCTDGGETGDSRPDDEHLCRRNPAGRGHLACEEPAVEARGLDDGAVAGDVGHRRQGIHLLGSCDARHLVDGNCRDLCRGESLNECLVLARPQETDQCRPGTQQVAFVHTKRAMLLGGPDLQKDVGIAPELACITDQRSAHSAVVVVSERCSRAGVDFDENLEAEFLEFGDRFRCRRHAPLARM